MLKILAPVKRVADYNAKIRIKPDGFVTPRRTCGPSGGPIAKGMKKISYSGYHFRRRSFSGRFGSTSGSR